MFPPYELWLLVSRVLAPSPRISTHWASRTGLHIPTFVRNAVTASPIVDFAAGVVTRSVVALDIPQPGPRGAGDVFDRPVAVAG